MDAALTYSNWVVAGAVLIWLFNSLAAVIRATGNMAVPAIVTLAGTAILVPLSPVLIFGWGPIPALGIAGGAIALLAYYAAGTGVLWAYLWSGKSVLHRSSKYRQIGQPTCPSRRANSSPGWRQGFHLLLAFSRREAFLPSQR